MRQPVQTHNFTATYQEGIVSQVDDRTHRIKVKIPALEDFETAWLSYLAPNAGGNQFYCLPDEGELVALILDARGEGGCVLGAIYNHQDPTPVASRDIWKKQFSNGTTIEHNRKSGALTLHTTGAVIVNNSPVNVNGGTVTVKDGDVIADGISLKNHTHGGISRGASKTDKPS
ncbi:phage baseplate assembly protein V [Pasteurellaceae bacterium USgator11]|nr:phage baseplate assembly protein V [Pasteurellaceae bacterium USgator41]TNG96945.1 phage baseplate assembly protein V [Pasteurellaceae bacterium UScroc12]TNG97851.1 phage baseplate assembly protein V [Pasteurellaceae bacterium UScroc31]TNH02916.1 phage baseplate assembly protein V [Pasteurellaceae bacterium USgator11]